MVSMQEPEWIFEYKMLHPRGGKRILMLRPRYPPIYNENQMPDASDILEVGVVVNDGWKVGNLVDWWNSSCYWAGRISELSGDDEVKIELFPPPLGEGGDPYPADLKDLRPTLEWCPELGWMMPKEDPYPQANSSRSPPCAWLVKPINQDAPGAVQENEGGRRSVRNAIKEAESVQLKTPSAAPETESQGMVPDAITEADSGQCKTHNAVQETEVDQGTTTSPVQENEGCSETAPNAVQETGGGSRKFLNAVRKSEGSHVALPNAVQETDDGHDTASTALQEIEGGSETSPNAVQETVGGRRTTPSGDRESEGGHGTLPNAVQETDGCHKTTPTALHEIEGRHRATRSSVRPSHSSPASGKSSAVQNDQKSTGKMGMQKRFLRGTVSEEVRQTQEESSSMECGDSSTRKTCLKDATDSGQSSAAPMAEVAEEDLNSSSPKKKHRAGEGSSLRSMHSDTMEAAVLDLEECLNKVKWLKAILRDGIPSPESARPQWEFAGTSSIPKYMHGKDM